MPEPVVSIIVPVYNVEAYLEECLRSLTAQTLADIEIICIDDGSTDGSPELLDELAAKDARIRAIHQANAGVAATRNRGIGLARGEYVLFVDSDDYIAARTCEVLCARARAERADIVVFGGKTFPTLPWADDSFARRDKVYRGASVDALFYEAGSTPLMCNKLYSAKFLRDNDLRFNEGLTLGEDHAFQFVAFPLANCIAFMGDMLYFYRVRADSAVGATSTDGARQLFLHFDVVKHALGAWKERGLFAERRREALSWAIDFLHNSAVITYYNDRVRFAKEFSAYLSDLLDGDDVDAVGLDAGKRDSLRFLLDPKDDVRPLFSVIVDCADESDDAKDALGSLEFQFHQAFEMLFLPPLREDSVYASAVRKFASKDSRARILSSRDPKAVLGEARGAYVLRMFANDSYETGTLRQLRAIVLGEAADTREGGPDDVSGAAPQVVTFADSAGILPVRDLLDFYQPSIEEVFAREAVRPASDFGANLLSFSSAASGNKLFARDFLLASAQELSCATWDALQLAALALAERIVPTRRPLLTVRALSFADGGAESTNAMFERVFTGFDEARGILSGFDAAPLLLEGLDAAMASYFVFANSLVRNPEARRALCVAAAQTWGADALARAEAGSQLSEKEREHVRSLLEDPFDVYTDRCDCDLLNGIIAENERNLLAVGGQAARIDKLNSDIEEFYGSISYRAGRAVTAPARAAVKLLAGAAHRVLPGK